MPSDQEREAVQRNDVRFVDPTQRRERQDNEMAGVRQVRIANDDARTGDRTSETGEATHQTTAGAEQAESVTVESPGNVMRSANGAEVWVPSLAEIRAACAEIRAEWTDAEYRRRRAAMPHDLDEGPCHETHESTRDRSRITSCNVRESDAGGLTVPSHQADGLSGGTGADRADTRSSLLSVN
ncbi:hypothetical protein [Schlesneria sp. DSM 10557]|uniref:hypothetical protein n=1 Tax=Schlesneria sp. DSM 10557 TaxID=3044399 RepID=UPI0035A01DC2